MERSVGGPGMDRPPKGKSGGTSAGPGHLAISTFSALVDSPGRRRVRIFGLPREQLIMAAVAFPLLGMPFAIMVAMAPLWEWVGALPLITQLNSYVAPEVHALTYDYRAQDAPQFPVKRFLIASTIMFELVLLSNFIALFARGVRRHALIVWTCYDRPKLLKYFLICALAFFALWYILFFNWTIWSFIHATPRGRRLAIYSVMAMPFVTFVFGHLAAMIAIGLWRSAARQLRALRKVPL